MSESYHTVQQLTQRVETLQAELAESQEKESQAITKLTEATKNVDLLQTMNTNARESAKELKNELDRVRDKLCKVEATIREKEAAICALGVENTRLAPGPVVNGTVVDTEGNYNVSSNMSEDDSFVSMPDRRRSVFAQYSTKSLVRLMELLVNPLCFFSQRNTLRYNAQTLPKNIHYQLKRSRGEHKTHQTCPRATE